MKAKHTFINKYELLEGDCIPFLQSFRGTGTLITGIPDSKEINMSVEEWTPWYMNTVKLCLDFVPENAPVIFLQIDRKEGGRHICKLDLTCQAARNHQKRFLFDKIILRREVGKIDMFHVTFMHMIVFGGNGVNIGKTTPDVIDGGEKLWKWGIGIEACRFACEFAKRFTDTVYDPFCGYGTVLKAANDLGMKAFGVDIDPKRIAITRKILEGQDV